MTGAEAGRLAALEQTLVAAAARQAEGRRRRRRRAVALLAVGAPLVLAAASVGATKGFFGGVDEQFATLRDDRLIPRNVPSTGLSNALGSAPRDWQSRRAWSIAGQRVSGFTTRSGSFCYRFGSFTGGCVSPGELSAANPIDYTSDYGPKTFRVYGLATDDVTAVSLRVRGVTRRVRLVRNAIYLSDDALGGTRPFRGVLIVHLRGGATRRVPVVAGGGLRPGGSVLPNFPGIMPVRNTAA